MNYVDRRQLLSFALALLGLSSLGAVAQNAYPNQPIKIIVPFTPGTGMDTIARVMAPRLSERLGQPVGLSDKSRPQPLRVEIPVREQQRQAHHLPPATRRQRPLRHALDIHEDRADVCLGYRRAHIFDKMQVKTAVELAGLLK